MQLKLQKKDEIHSLHSLIVLLSTKTFREICIATSRVPFSLQPTNEGDLPQRNMVLGAFLSILTLQGEEILVHHKLSIDVLTTLENLKDN